MNGGTRTDANKTLDGRPNIVVAVAESDESVRYSTLHGGVIRVEREWSAGQIALQQPLVKILVRSSSGSSSFRKICTILSSVCCRSPARRTASTASRFTVSLAP